MLNFPWPQDDWGSWWLLRENRRPRTAGAVSESWPYPAVRSPRGRLPLGSLPSARGERRGGERRRRQLSVRYERRSGGDRRYGRAAARCGSLLDVYC